MKLFRRSILAVTVLLLFAGSAFGADFTAAASGDWTSNVTWGKGEGAVEGTNYPGPNHTVDLATYVVALNQTTIPTTGRLGAITASGAGRMTVALQTAGTCRAFYCGDMTVGSAAANALLQLTGTTDNNFLLDCGAMNCGLTASNIVFYVNTTATTGRATVNCASITAGIASSYGINHYTNGPLTVNITGDITGGTAASLGIYQHANGNVTINGAGTNKIIGGSFAAANGFQTQGTGGYTINDMVIEGGSVYNAFGIAQSTGTAGTLHGCNLVYATNSPPINGIMPTMDPDADNTISFGAVLYAKQKTATELKKGVVNGTVTGTFVPTHGIL